MSGVTAEHLHIIMREQSVVTWPLSSMEQDMIELTRAYSNTSLHTYRKWSVQEMAKNTTWNVLGMHA